MQFSAEEWMNTNFNQCLLTWFYMIMFNSIKYSYYKLYERYNGNEIGLCATMTFLMIIVEFISKTQDSKIKLNRDYHLNASM